MIRARSLGSTGACPLGTVQEESIPCSVTPIDVPSVRANPFLEQARLPQVLRGRHRSQERKTPPCRTCSFQLNPDLPLARARVQPIKAGCCSMSKNQYSTSTVPKTREVPWASCKGAGLRHSGPALRPSTSDWGSQWPQILGHADYAHISHPAPFPSQKA